MSVRSLQSRIDWGHLLVLSILTAITIWYLRDAMNASSSVRNLILVLPASILALVLAAIIAAGVILRALRPETTEFELAEEVAPKPLRQRIYPFVLMAIFALYVLTLPVAGFDVGSALFVLVALIVDGERRPLMLVGYPIAFAVICTLLFRWLLPYPMTTLLL